MSKANQKATWVALAVVGACGLGLWTAGSALFGDDSAQGTAQLTNRPWIERVPANERDMIGHLILLDHPQGRFGVTGRSSNWRHLLEVYRWRLDGDRLGLFFPQDHVKVGVKVRTWECGGEAPAPFDLCLEITDARGRKAVVYSREDWEVRPERLEADLANIAEELADDDQPALAAVLGAADSWTSDSQLGALEALDLDSRDWAEEEAFSPF